MSGIGYAIGDTLKYFGQPILAWGLIIAGSVAGFSKRTIWLPSLFIGVGLWVWTILQVPDSSHQFSIALKHFGQSSLGLSLMMVGCASGFMKLKGFWHVTLFIGTALWVWYVFQMP
jgi:hypothetical protein